MRDAVVLGMLVLGFAGFITTHFVLAVMLLFAERPRWRGAVALLVPPLGALWAWRAGRKPTVVLWIVSVLLYGVGRAMSALT
ncbi:MAG: hypothetical protein U0271_41990 [Polyangiaceae bacterium]